ncbi:MAG: amidohydrolase family protein [Gammaproteobacteria bacterium]|nr:amidohydrolase family protein [Gammaproteobacteria bacterium]
MNKSVLTSMALGLLLLFANTGHADTGTPSFSHTGPVLIKSVNVIDGLGSKSQRNRDILVVDGKIRSIAKTGSTVVPTDAMVIEGKGLSAMPGLIDMHIHLQGGWANASLPGDRYKTRYDDAALQQRLNGYLYAGVTSVLDVGNDHDYIVKTRDRVNAGELIGPRMFVSGAAWSQAPSGWDAASENEQGAGGGFNLSTKVADLIKIPEQLDLYTKDGIDIIKLYTGISHHAAQFLIEEAHKRDIKVIADLWSLNLDRIFMQATGLDGWAHSGGFEVVGRENQTWMAENARFVIVTANVGEKLAGLRVADENGKRLMLQEPLIVDIWGRDEVEHFYEIYPAIRENQYEGPNSFYQQMDFGDMKRFRANFLKNIKDSYDAGVLIAGGTDDIYPSLWAGESMHRELELLVMAGIPARDAIKICSYNAARILRREDQFGSLQEGLAADILLVEGDPGRNISDSRNVEYVLSAGRIVDRSSLKKE